MENKIYWNKGLKIKVVSEFMGEITLEYVDTNTLDSDTVKGIYFKSIFNIL